MDDLTRRPPLPPLALYVSTWALLALSACTYDFDSFEGGEPPAEDMTASDDGTSVGEDMSALDMQDPADDGGGDPDMGADMADMPAPPDVEVGASCQGDGDCGEGICEAGYCTFECSAESLCPAGSTCQRVGSQRHLCLVDCGEGDACQITGREDLTCLTGASPSSFDVRAQTWRACLPDADGDGIEDMHDNCPMQGNPRQLDRDHDGQGDACDAEPLCHPGQMQGKVDHGRVSGVPLRYSAPHMLTDGALTLLGGVDEMGQAQATRVELDRLTSQWSELPDNLYPGIDFAMARARTGELLVSPGRAPEDERQTGRFLIMSPDGSIEQGAPLAQEVYDPVLATTGHGIPLMMGFLQPESSGGDTISIWRVDPSSGGTSTLYTSGTRVRVRWYATRAGNGDVLFYSSPQVRDGDAPSMRIVRISVRGTSVSARDIDLPEPDAQLGPLDPVLIEPASGLQLIIDRKRGLAYELVEDEASGTLQPQRRAELDIVISLANPEFVALPGAPSFVMLGRSPEDMSSLQAIEYNLACVPGAAGLDGDGDGVELFRDNCPAAANADQADADRDGRGDVCDDDDDNDGIADAADVVTDPMTMMESSLAQDSDDDGQANDADADADADGIADTSDRFWLDTNNDGLPNEYDVDDDSDGYNDNQERGQRTDPFDPLSFPDAGRVLFVRRSAGGERTVSWGELGALDEAVEVTWPMDATPHLPRFSPSGRSVIALDGEPGQATAIIWSRIDNGEMELMPSPRREELGVPLRGVAADVVINDPMLGEELRRVVAAHGRGDGSGRWDLSRFEASVDAMTMLRGQELWLSTFPEVASPYVHGNRVYFLGAPTRCEACLTAYQKNQSAGDDPRARVPGLVGLTWLSFNGDRYGVVAPSAETGAPVAYSNEAERMPPEAVSADSAAAMNAQGHMVVSARGEDGTYDLWFFNGRNGKWYRLLTSNEDLIEIDWKR